MTRVDKPNHTHSHAQSPSKDHPTTSGLAISGGKSTNLPIHYKFKIDIKDETVNNIALYKEKYEKYLKMHNNTANKDVWKIYDHIADDLFHELYQQAIKEVSKDMEEYIEKVIYDEF